MPVNPSAARKEVDIIINADGTINVDQLGWQGKGCDGAIDDLLKILGRKKTQRKQEYYKEQKVTINQRHTG